MQTDHYRKEDSFGWSLVCGTLILHSG